MNNNYTIVADKLNTFIESKQIPNIIFHGDCSSKKEEIVSTFIHQVYGDDKLIQKYVMFVECAHGKGIKFVREDLKYFAKTNVNNQIFKSIVLYNADKLTIDAQSALRRCIEIFSHSTRFFMVVDNISKLLNPIHSRFCSIYVCEENNRLYNQLLTPAKIKSLLKMTEKLNESNIFQVAEKIYNRGFSGLNLLECISKFYDKLESGKHRFALFYLNKIKKDIRDERLFILTILNFMANDWDIELDEVHYI